MRTEPEFIESTAGQIAAELARRGIPPEQRVMLTIDPEQELIPGRLASRIRVMAAALTTDDEIDKLIEEARDDVQSTLR